MPLGYDFDVPQASSQKRWLRKAMAALESEKTRLFDLASAAATVLRHKRSKRSALPWAMRALSAALAGIWSRNARASVID